MVKAKLLPETELWPPVPLGQIETFWTVMRCPGAKTLGFAQELRNAGVKAWAPMYQHCRRLPRTKKKECKIQALLPSFVFVGLSDLDKALGLVERGRVSQATVFHFNGDRVVVHVAALGPLYLAQQNGMAPAAKLLPIGAKVEVMSGLFHYQTGKIIGTRPNRMYLVELEPQNTRVIIPGFMLQLA